MEIWRETNGAEARGPDPMKDVVSVIGEHGAPVASAADLVRSRDEALAMHGELVMLRALEAALGSLVRAKKLAYHVSAVGQEACLVGALRAARARDVIVPSRRELGALLLRGASAAEVFARVLGVEGDPSRGRSAPPHVSSRARGLVSTSPLKGTQLPHAAGIAWALRRGGAPGEAVGAGADRGRGSDEGGREGGRRDAGGAAGAGFRGAVESASERPVVLAFVEAEELDSEGFHTGVNFAGVFKLPIVFVCRNDVRASRGAVPKASDGAAWRSISYGVEGVRADGNDALAVVRAVRAGIGRAERGEGPTLVELLTSRRATKADLSLVPADVGSYRFADPIERFERYLAHVYDVDLRELATRKTRAALAMEAAALAATSSLTSPPDALFDDVYATSTRGLEEDRRALAALREGDETPAV